MSALDHAVVWVWPVVLLAVLILDAVLWSRYGDGATLSGWLGAWCRASTYRVTWLIVVLAWIGPHLLFGASVTVLFKSLAGVTVIVFLLRLAKSYLKTTVRW